jgi:hypothetical protein
MATETARGGRSTALRPLVAVVLGLGVLVAAAPAWAEPGRERDPHAHLRDWGHWKLEGSHDPVSQRAVRRALPPRREALRGPLPSPTAVAKPHVAFRALALAFRVVHTIVTVVEVTVALPLLFARIR